MNLSKQAIIFRGLDKGEDISEISRRVGYSREGVYKIIRKRFLTAKDAQIPKSKRIEVEIGEKEDPKDTMEFYKNLGYRYIGSYKDPRDAQATILLFAF
jgi:hypothetical protein